jgi:hypothetical protein
MADESPEERKWLVEPPAAGQVTVLVAAGDGVELNEEQRAALEALLMSLQESGDEVSGFAGDCNISTCKPREITMPCAMLIGSCTEFSACQISKVGRFY